MHRNDMTRRRRLARKVTAATDVEQPITCRGCAYPYLVHPTITAACTPSLSAIATVLREEQHPITAGTLGSVRTFVSDGTSPFFGRDATRRTPRGSPPSRSRRCRPRESHGPRHSRSQHG